MTSFLGSTLGLETAGVSSINADIPTSLPPNITDIACNITSQNDTEKCQLDGETSESLVVAIFKITAMVLIMLCAAFGNMLVIISVLKFERLRLIANSFIVSLAFADLTVALLVMPFNASQEIAGKWVFGRTMCYIFNANDVLFSTASLTHLCCISMDRYIAITDPFHYESKMTKRRVAIMLSCAWGASALISHIPIHLDWYTTEEYKGQPAEDQCPFVVNKIYGLISSTISFWTPTFIMVFTYVKIYREARKQEKHIHSLSRASVPAMDSLRTESTTTSTSINGNVSLSRTRNGSFQSDRFTQERRKMKREHKAAKTLGIIMGGFLLCWLPFFTWYVSSTMCGEHCHTPAVVVSILFWIGYFNSALNPLIYACFNRDFRNAFKRLLFCGRHRHSAGCQPCCMSYPGSKSDRRSCLCCCLPSSSRNNHSGSENVALKPTFREFCSQTCNSRSNDSGSSFQSNNNSPELTRNPRTTTYDSVH